MDSPTRMTPRSGIAVFWTSALALCLASLTGCGPEIAASPPATPEPPTSSAANKSIEPSVAPAAAESAPAEPAPAAPPITDTRSAPNTESPANDAEPAPRPAGKRPTADRTPARPGEAEKITFEDLVLGMQADVVFRPFMLTDRAKELEGKRVSIMGYIHPGATGKTKEFVLLRNTECKFGPGGQADHLAMVYLAEGQTTEYQPKPVKVEGKLKIEPFEGPTDGNTWAIYRLENALMK